MLGAVEHEGVARSKQSQDTQDIEQNRDRAALPIDLFDPTEERR
jgi:hypothetical protein